MATITVQKRWLAFFAALLTFLTSFATNYLNDNPLVIGDASQVHNPAALQLPRY